MLCHFTGLGVEILAGTEGPIFIQAQSGSAVIDISAIGRAGAWMGEVIILAGGQAPAMVLWMEIDALVKGSPQGVVDVIS